MLSFEQQYAKKRTKRDYIFEHFSEGEPPKDPLYTKMFYLDPNFPGRESPEDIRHMNITGAWAQGFSGKGVVLTILDDGIEHTHRKGLSFICVGGDIIKRPKSNTT